MVHPASVLLFFHSLAIQRETTSSAPGYYLIAVLFLLFWALIVFGYVVYVVFTDDIGKPYAPYDDYGVDEAHARRERRDREEDRPAELHSASTDPDANPSRRSDLAHRSTTA